MPPELLCDAFVKPVLALTPGAMVLLPTGRSHHC